MLELNGPEVPIIDGSSAPFVQLIEEAGIEEQEEDKIWYTLDENIEYIDNKRGWSSMPYPQMIIR
jgi:UDP-3-O-[3-hydroxymyristoyl] N-acetylglucosamine deacetylase/3-hydroxyacyl-[acyl-carrier-protein] dehydratase